MKIFLYYTHDAKSRDMTTSVFDDLRKKARKAHAKIVSVTRLGRPTADIDIILGNDGGAPAGIYRRILKGLQVVGKHDTVYLCEDDVLYSPDHFRFRPHPEKICYDLELTYLTPTGFTDNGFGRCGIALSMAFATADYMQRCIAWKLDEIDKNDFNCYEPAQGGPRDYKSATCRSGVANVDIRAGQNATWTPTGVNMFGHLDGWGDYGDLLTMFSIKESKIKHV